jgi:rod shape-determining protein MreC
LAFRDGPLQDLKVPLTWTAAIAAIFCALVALGVLLTDSREQAGSGGAYGAARGEFDQAIRPVSSVFAVPLEWLGAAGTEVRGYFFAVSENRRLKARLKELERYRDEAVALRNVNTRYEQLLALRTDPPLPMISARVVTDVRGPFSNARLADAGRDRGVKIGFPVLSDHGVVGRVVGVADGVSRVLLLSDVDSRTPVLVDRTGARAILTGDGGAAPRLEYLRGADPIRNGDMVLTSGDGGLFPRGLPVGVAAKDLRGGWRVRLYAEGQDVDYVRILAFDDFSKLAAAQLAALNARAVPPLDPAAAAQLAAQAAAQSAAKSMTATDAKPAADSATTAAAKTPAGGTSDAKLRGGAGSSTSVPSSRPASAPAKTKATTRRPTGRDSMAPIPDDAAPRAARPANPISPDLEAAMRREPAR